MFGTTSTPPNGRDYWYGKATDADGNDYLVCFEELEDYNFEEDMDSDACDWDKPFLILMENDDILSAGGGYYIDVTDQVKVVWRG